MKSTTEPVATVFGLLRGRRVEGGLRGGDKLRGKFDAISVDHKLTGQRKRKEICLEASDFLEKVDRESCTVVTV
jgi:hypothetical protein